MGCRHSKFAEKNRHSESLTIDDKGPAVNEAESMNDNLSIADGKVPYLSIEETPSPELSNEQKELIIETWKMLVENISSVGVITFMSLFETHPDVQDVFMPFKGMSKEELQHSRQLRAHGLRVMGFVQKVVSRLDEPEKSEQLLEELGRNHIKYGAKADYVDLIGPQFVFAVKPSMEEQWTEDIEEAWMQLFRYMSHIMKRSMHSVEGGSTASKPGPKQLASCAKTVSEQRSSKTDEIN